MKLTPLDDRLIAKRVLAQEKTNSGIYLPDSAKQKPQQATVISVGPGRLLDDGRRAPMAVQQGQTILLSKWGGSEIELDGEQVVIVREDEVLAIVE